MSLCLKVLRTEKLYKLSGRTHTNCTQFAIMLGQRYTLPHRRNIHSYVCPNVCGDQRRHNVLQIVDIFQFNEVLILNFHMHAQPGNREQSQKDYRLIEMRHWGHFNGNVNENENVSENVSDKAIKMLNCCWPEQQTVPINSFISQLFAGDQLTLPDYSYAAQCSTSRATHHYAYPLQHPWRLRQLQVLVARTRDLSPAVFPFPFTFSFPFHCLCMCQVAAKCHTAQYQKYAKLVCQQILKGESHGSKV